MEDKAQTRSAECRAAIQEIRDRLAKLDRVDEIVFAVSLMHDAVGRLSLVSSLRRQYRCRRFR